MLPMNPVEVESRERVHGIYAQGCPIYRSIHPQITVTSEVAFR